MAPMYIRISSCLLLAYSFMFIAVDPLFILLIAIYFIALTAVLRSEMKQCYILSVSIELIWIGYIILDFVRSYPGRKLGASTLFEVMSCAAFCLPWFIGVILKAFRVMRIHK